MEIIIKTNKQTKIKKIKLKKTKKINPKRC